MKLWASFKQNMHIIKLLYINIMNINELEKKMKNEPMN